MHGNFIGEFGRRVSHEYSVENWHEGSIYTTPTPTMDVWIRRVWVWKGLRDIGIEAMVFLMGWLVAHTGSDFSRSDPSMICKVAEFCQFSNEEGGGERWPVTSPALPDQMIEV